MKKAIQILKSSELDWWNTYKRDIKLAFKISHHNNHHHQGAKKCTGEQTK